MASICIFYGESGGVGKSTTAKAYMEYVKEYFKQYKLYDLDVVKLDVGKIYAPDTYGLKEEPGTNNADKDNATAFIRFTEDIRGKSKINAIFEEAIENNIILNTPANCKIILERWLDDNQIPVLIEGTNFKFVNFFVSTGDEDSINLFVKTVKKYPHSLGLHHVFVLNSWKGYALEELKQNNSSLEEYLETEGIPSMTMPVLDETVYKEIISKELTFQDAVKSKEIGLLGRSATFKFIQEAKQEFKRVLQEINFNPDAQVSIEDLVSNIGIAPQVVNDEEH